MAEIHLIVGLKSRPGVEDKLRQDLLTLIEPSRQEEGNISYDLYEDINEVGRFVFIEHWESSEAQQKHHNLAPHIQYFHENGDRNVESRDFIHVLKKLS